MTHLSDFKYLPQAGFKNSVGEPFLSVICRTQGRRQIALQEVLTSLAAQSEPDFELLILAHKVENEKMEEIQNLIKIQPTWLQSKIQLVDIHYGNRVAPLNLGLDLIRGKYFVVLDDDDLPFAHWVSTFKKISRNQKSTLLRAGVVRQSVEEVSTRFGNAIKATGPLEKMYLKPFNVLENAHVNICPPSSIAYPTKEIKEAGLRFDENLDTQEDWDFMMRSAFKLGITEELEITSIYRWWIKGESSRTQHSEKIWALNRAYVLNKFNNLSVSLQPGWLIEEQIPRSESLITRQIFEIVDSKIWKVAQFFTKPKRILQKKKGLRVGDLFYMNMLEKEITLNALRTSRVIKASNRCRRILRNLKRVTRGN